MSDRVEAALEATGLSSKYSDALKRAQITDTAVDLCLKKSYKNISNVISSPNDYALFIQAYLNPTTEVLHNSSNNLDKNFAEADSVKENEEPSTPTMSIQNSSGNFLEEENPVFEAESEASLVNECYTVYAKQVQEIKIPVEKNTYMLEAELQNIHKIAKDSALVLFNSKIPAAQDHTDNSDDLCALKNKLIYLIEQLYNNIIALNDQARSSVLKEASLQLKQYLQNLIHMKIPDCTIPNPIDDDSEFVLVQDNASILKECEENALTFFQILVNLDNLDSCPSAKKAFQEVLESFQSFPDPQSMIPEGVEALDVEEAVHRFNTELLQTIKTSNQYWSPEQLKKLQESTHESIMKALKNNGEEAKRLLMESFENNSDINSSEVQLAVEEQNEKYLQTCNQLVWDFVNVFSQNMEEVAREPHGRMLAIHEEARSNICGIFQSFQGFDSLPSKEAEGLLADLSFRVDECSHHIVNKWYPRHRQAFIKNYIKSLDNSLYGVASDVENETENDRIFTDEELEEGHQKFKLIACNDFNSFLSTLPAAPFAQVGLSKTEADLTVILEDFEADLESRKEDLIAQNELRKHALRDDAQGYVLKAKLLHLKSIEEINRTFHNEDTYQELMAGAQDDVKRSFQDRCRDQLMALNRTSLLLSDLQTFMNTTPQFKMILDNILEITGTSILFSRDLGGILESSYENSSQNEIMEVRLIASKEIIIDQNICGDFWSGKNLVLYTKNIVHVVGRERIIDVSGENGRSAATTLKPETPGESGVNGTNGEDGEPGSNGGNILIIAREIQNPENLRLVSNGGNGGNGQPGGDASDGKEGNDGDQRFKMSQEDLERRFPSPAIFFGTRSSGKVQTGKESLEEIAKANEVELVCLDGCKNGSVCYSLETKEGAKIHYGFYQKAKMNAIVVGRSFYVWVEGAPGSLGQRGGYQGLGGRGGLPGHPGSIQIPANYENTVTTTCREGTKGASRDKGKHGTNGRDGKRGTDYALLHPYATRGLHLAGNSIKTFSGHLQMEFIDGDFNSKATAEAAFCPHRRKHFTFTLIEQNENLNHVRIQEFKNPEKPLPRIPLKTSQAIIPVSSQDIESKYATFV